MAHFARKRYKDEVWSRLINLDHAQTKIMSPLIDFERFLEKNPDYRVTAAEQAWFRETDAEATRLGVKIQRAKEALDKDDPEQAERILRSK